jgi:PTS system nitrogen regulatory IIA component
MKLFDILRPECIEAGAVLKDKESALRRVAGLAKKCVALKDVSEADLLEGLKKREELGSTGFGGGIAIPHCRLEGVSDFVAGIITAPSGVEFESLDGGKAQLIIFIIAPARETNEHLRLLSAVSQVLRIPGVVKEVLSETSPESVRESFLRYARDDVDTRGHANKHMFHLFVQDEDVFRELLNAFASMESASVTVMESRNSREYLSKMPLFAGLWSDKFAGFSRTIVAIVEKTMTNEVIRRIESITGHLDDARRVMVTIQEVFYTAGSLEA